MALSKGLAEKCRATNALVFPHVTTRNTARDMDVIRGALGERKISYLGYSYGTYLGTVYTQMFPWTTTAWSWTGRWPRATTAPGC
ncbi:hypothetical protein SMICM17S_04700 [Streptomyces microflavus]